MTGREDFGPALRRERERRGITLEQIAERTKISASLFAAMERNDFSRWPNGIFRRSFLRAYAEVVGLDGDALVEEFLQLFPSPDHDVPTASRAQQNAPVAHAHTVGARQRAAHGQQASVSAEAAECKRQERADRTAATLADLGIVALLAAVGWVLGGWLGVGPGAALAGTLVFIVGNGVLGKTPGSWLMGIRSEPAPAPALAVATHVAVPATRVVADERVTANRRPMIESHSSPRRHTVRRVARSRSRRA